MDLHDRIETGLQTALRHATGPGCPPRLGEALRHAVFPGGARIRPRLALAVAAACGDRHPDTATGTAVAVEFLHCASLVHDDMPCFDNAATRRGLPSVHARFGESTALLCGDGLIVAAFEVIAREARATPELIAPLVAVLARAVGSPNGLVAGQAWEGEPVIDVERYHRAKTAALFSGAVHAGAIAGGGNVQDWTGLGDALGAAYQVADDLYDAAGDADAGGKPCGQDDRLARPNIVHELGIAGALDRLKSHVAAAADCVPDCDGAAAFRAMIGVEAKRLMPKKFAASAA